MATIQNAYHKSNYYAEVMPLLEDIIGNPEDDLTEFIMYSIQKNKSLSGHTDESKKILTDREGCIIKGTRQNY